MRDPAFIEEMIKKGKEAEEKVQLEFSGLSLTQLNWKAGPGRWSIGQCLDHLLISDCSYFPTLRKIADGTHKMSFWEKWDPFSVLFGRMLVTQLQEKVKRKIKAPSIFTPSIHDINPGIFERFSKHQDTLLEYISACKAVNLDRVHISSPVTKIITYSLRNAITILIQHQHRHINQALKVKNKLDKAIAG